MGVPDGGFSLTQNQARELADEPRIVVNERTGGMKETKLERFDLIPPDVLALLARHYGRGAEKYAPNQWRKGYDWSLSYAALQRHLNAYWGGEEDTETGSLHLIAAAWHCFTLTWFSGHHPELDDRP